MVKITKPYHIEHAKKSLSEKVNDIFKARAIKNPNKYIWINRGKDNFVITDSKVKLENYSEGDGIAFYWKEKKSNIILWRFEKSKGWTENSAKIFALSFNPNFEQVEDSMKIIQNYDDEELLNYDIRKSIYEFLKKFYKKEDHKIPKLNNQFIYKNKKSMDDKMKLLADLSNQELEEFLEEAKKQRLDIVKSKDSKKSNDIFKVHGDLKAFKTFEKNKKGEEIEKWKLKTTFTSNKADLHLDVTSKKAIKKGIKKLQGEVIAIRFEHQSLDYGAWDTFRTYEKNGILYGEAEGELDKNLRRTQDLWKEIYDYGKRFATSYGGKSLDWHYIEDEETGYILRVFDDIKWFEISLTTRPANPDTAMEVMNKYASKIEDTIDTNNLIIKSSKMAKSKKETAKKAVEPKNKETVKKAVKPKKNAITNTDLAKSIVEVAKSIENLNKSLEENQAESGSAIDELSKRLEKLEEAPAKRKSVIKSKEIDKVEDPEDKEKDKEEKKSEVELSKRYPLTMSLFKAKKEKLNN